jgi:biopolymer transport protein ExbB
MNRNSSLVQLALDAPLFHAEWVLYLLLAISLASIAVMVERTLFYRRRRLELTPLRTAFSGALAKGSYDEAAKLLGAHDTLETNVVLFALREHASGPDAVEDLLLGATQKERERYDERLGLLATISSTAPFIGLFGTVLGIIHAFKDLAANSQDAASSTMAGVAEALVTTAVGLLVAIPALIAFNAFKSRVKLAVNNTQFLSRILLAHLKSAA